jgi:Flp pilus assembly protein TadG
MGNRIRIFLGKLSDENGQTAVTAELGLLLVIGFVALAVEAGHLYNVKRQAQLAADAAAIAGALEIQACGASNNCSAMQTAAQTALSENGLPGSTVATNCASSTGGLVVTVNDPPCALGARDPNNGKSGFVEVTVSESAPTYFAKIIGIPSMSILARAEAARVGGGNCIYALDPTASNSISVDLAAVVNSNCGMVDESNSDTAFGCNLLAAVNATHISVHGGAESLLCGISPSPSTGATVPSPADPLASLPKPTVPQCGSSTGSPYYGASGPITIAGTAVLSPSFAYCGGITILPTANVTFLPGTYVIKSTQGLLGINPGGLTIALGANVSGTGVTFYNYGPSGGVTFLLSSVTLGGVTLTAPTSGTYNGILFFQDPGDTAPATILGNTSLNTDLEGAFYFPTARVSYAVSGPAKYDILVAYDIDFVLLTFGNSSLTSTFNSDYSGLTNGSPITAGRVALVQ